MAERTESESSTSATGAVRSIRPGDDFNTGSDIFMSFVEQDPVTCKVDTFGGVILAAHSLITQDMRKPNWQQIYDATSRKFELPAETAAQLEQVSLALLNQLKCNPALRQQPQLPFNFHGKIHRQASDTDR